MSLSRHELGQEDGSSWGGCWGGQERRDMFDVFICNIRASIVAFFYINLPYSANTFEENGHLASW